MSPGPKTRRSPSLCTTLAWSRRIIFANLFLFLCTPFFFPRQPGQGGAADRIDEDGFKAQLLEQEAKHEQKRKGNCAVVLENGVPEKVLHTVDTYCRNVSGRTGFTGVV